MNVMETIGASMAVKTSWVDTDVGAHKDIFSITSGINVLVRKQTAQDIFKQQRCHNVYIDNCQARTRMGSTKSMQTQIFSFSLPLLLYTYYSQHKSIHKVRKHTHPVETLCDKEFS